MPDGFPETRIRSDAPTFRLGNAFRFKGKDKVSYEIVADWVIAEYKSQWAIQYNGIHRTVHEIYRCYDINDPGGIPKVRKLFEDLSKSGYAAPGS